MMVQTPYTTPVPARSALLTIDVQKDFATPGAPGEMPGTQDCLPAMQHVLGAYRRQRLPVVHVVRLYRDDGTNVDLCRKEKIERGLRLVSPGSPGAELAEPLRPARYTRLDPECLLAGDLQTLDDREWALYKPRWDAFHQTPLESHLRSLNVSTVVVVGCNFPNCPRATVYGASMRDFRAALIADAVSGVYERGLQELRSIGIATLHSADVAFWLDGARAFAESAS
jgi:nicotinamidase-related amidase